MRLISIIISMFLIFSCVQSPLYAQTHALARGVIPADLAQVSDAFFKGNGERLVVNIQDLHSHEETQRNISAVLSYLDAKYKIDNIYVEGAVGEIDSAWLKNIKKTSYGEAVIERLMKDARLSGAEYFALQSERRIVLKGLEDEKLYIENLKRLKEIYAVRNEAAANLDELRARLKNLSKTALSSSSRKHISFFEKRRKALDERYFKYLLSAADSANVSLSYYPQIANYLELAKLQKNINYKKANRQINSFLKKLKEVLSYQDYKKLLDAQYKDEFYVNLSKFYGQYKASGKYFALEKFFTLIRLKQSVNFADLISEQKRLEREILHKNAKTLQEEDVLFLCENFEILQNLTDNKITAVEYSQFCKNEKRFFSLLNSYMLKSPVTKAKSYVRLFKDFYEINVLRNEYFYKAASGKFPDETENEITLLDGYKAKSAQKCFSGAQSIDVVITGGFHTEGLMRLFAKGGFSYAVITPNVSEISPDSEKIYAADILKQSYLFGSAFKQILDLSLLNFNTSKTMHALLSVTASYQIIDEIYKNTGDLRQFTEFFNLNFQNFQKNGISEIKILSADKTADGYKASFSYKNSKNETITGSFISGPEGVKLSEDDGISQEEIQAALDYSEGKLKTTVIEDDLKGVSKDDVVFIDELPQDEQDALLFSGANAIAQGEVYIAVPAGGAGSGMSRSAMPSSVKDMVGDKEIFSKANIPIGRHKGKIVSYLDAFAAGAAKLISEIGASAKKAGRANNTQNNVLAYMTNPQYEEEFETVFKEADYYGLNKKQIRSFSQPLGVNFNANIQAVRDSKPSSKSEEEYYAALAYAAYQRSQVLAGNQKAAVYENEKAPQGQGEFFHQMLLSKELLFIFDNGIKYITVGKIDNSAAKFDEHWLKLLGLFAQKAKNENVGFQAEVSQKVAGDNRGVWASRPDGTFVSVYQIFLSQSANESLNSYACNNAYGYFTPEYIAGLYMKDGQTLQEFIEEYRQASYDPELLAQIAKRGRDRFPKIVDAKPANDKTKITVTQDYLQAIKPLITAEEFAAISEMSGKMIEFNAVTAHQETDIWTSSLIENKSGQKMSLAGVYRATNIDIEKYLKMSWEEKKKILAKLRYLSTRQWDKTESQKLKALKNLNELLGLKEGEEGYIADLDDPRLLISLKTYAGNKLLTDDLIRYIFEEKAVESDIFANIPVPRIAASEKLSLKPSAVLRSAGAWFLEKAAEAIVKYHYLPSDKNLVREPEFFTTFRFGQYDLSDFTKPQIFQKIKSYGFDTAVLELDAQSVSDAVIMRNVIKQARENGVKIMAEWKIKNVNDFENVKKQISQMQIGKNLLYGIKFDISQLLRTKQKEATEEIIKIKESFAQNSVFAVSGFYFDKKSFEEGGLLRVYKVSHNDESLLQKALGDEGRVFIEFSTDGKNYDPNLSDYAKVERDVSEIAWAKTSGPVGVEFNVVSNMEKMANSRGSTEQLLNNIAKTKKDLNYLIPNDDEPLLTGRGRRKNIENGRKYFAAEERRQASANIGGSIAYFQKILDFNDINANESALRDLKDFFISIDAWDNPVNRASMVYVIKHKMRIFARTNYGVFFENENGKTLNFNISPEGKFYANEDFARKMEKLLRLRVFADMDGNLAHFTEQFSNETKEIFGELALYGTGAPSVITGNRKQSLDLRLSKVSEILKEKLVFYTDTGARRWVWDERMKDFNEDAAYKEKLNLSMASLRDYVRQTVKNLDYDFDGLYAVFVKASDGIDDYYQTAQAALKAMAYNKDLFEIILRQTQTANLDALIDKWQTFAPKDVDNVLDALEAKFINSSLQKDEIAYIELLKIVSMLEYCRISFSENPLDAGNKKVVLNQEIKEQILRGTYKKFNGDNETSVHLSPLRHTDINTRIASFYQKKLAGAGLSVRASGRVTINIQKTSNRKDQALLYAIERGVNAEDMVYSGDEMLFEGAQESSAGNDDDIAKFALQKYPEITVINSSLKKHDSKKRPNVIDSSSALSRNGVKPADSVESSMFVHKILLDRLEFNIGALAENEYFQPENLAQSLKEILQTGYLDKDGNETKIILPGQVIERQSGVTFDEEKQIEMALETRDFILKNYDIEKIYTIKLMASGINNLSIVFRLYTDKGDFIFKALTRDLDNARFIVNFQNTIHKKGLQVPQLVRLKLAKNIDKDNVLIQKDGAYFILETSMSAGIFMHHKVADFRHYKEFATYNAIIDNIAHSKDYHEQGTAPKKPEVYDMVIQTEQEYIKLKENIDAKPQKNEADLIALENFDFIMEQIRIFKENFSDEVQNSLVQSVSGFDTITFNNVFFDEETKNVTGVFDFGGTSMAPRVLAFDYMFIGIYGHFYQEFSYKYNGYDKIRKTYKEYNKIVNLKLTPQEITGALEISRGKFIYNIVHRRLINQDYGANIFSHPEMINYAQDNIAQFKKFASDFDAKNTDAFIKYVLYDNPKPGVEKHIKTPLIKTEKAILSAA